MSRKRSNQTELRARIFQFSISLRAECRGPESNRYSPCGEQDFKSCASTSFATPAEIDVPSEAPGGFEPPHKGFADLSLTTWVRRRSKQSPATWWDGGGGAA